MVFDPLPVSLDPEMVLVSTRLLVLRGSSHPFPRAEKPAVAYLERQSCEQVFPETCNLFPTLFTLRGCSRLPGPQAQLLVHHAQGRPRRQGGLPSGRYHLPTVYLGRPATLVGSLFLCCCSVAKLYPTVQPRGLQHSQASLPFTITWSLLKFMSIKSVMPANHLILCRPLLLLPSIFPSIRVFSSESAILIRWSLHLSKTSLQFMVLLSLFGCWPDHPPKPWLLTYTVQYGSHEPQVNLS